MTPLLPEEKAFIESWLQRCDVCGHLNGLHNFHCCEFCRVPGCRCRFGEIADEVSIVENSEYL